MSANLEIIGHLGSAPEVKKVNENLIVAEVSVATTEKWEDKKTKESKEQTDWHTAKFYNQLAEQAQKHKKGAWVKISGKLKYDEYDDKNGSKQKRAYLHAFKIEDGPEKKNV